MAKEAVEDKAERSEKGKPERLWMADKYTINLIMHMAPLMKNLKLGSKLNCPIVQINHICWT